MSAHENLRRRWVTALSSTMLMGSAGLVMEQGRRWSGTRRLDWAPGGSVADAARVSAARIPSARKLAPPITTILPVHEQRHVITEQIFRDFLVREQKRAERFSEPFVLLLLGLEDQVSAAIAAKAWKAATAALLASSRETDVVGWVTKGRVLGLVLTEINAAGEAIARDVEARIRQELASRLDARTQANLAMRLHFNVRTSATGEPEGLWPADPMLFDAPQAKRSKLRDTLKRAVDVAGSACFCLLVLSPVFLLIAALVKLTSPGPVFFRQARVGQRAKPFTMLKFRTHARERRRSAPPGVRHAVHPVERGRGNAPATTTLFKLTNDPRITPLGRIPPQDEPRRAAAVLERAARARCRWSDRGRRCRTRSSSTSRWHWRPRARGQAGHHRAVAGERPQPHDVRRDGASRSPLRQDALALDRHQDSARDARARVIARQRCGANDSRGMMPKVKTRGEVRSCHRAGREARAGRQARASSSTCTAARSATRPRSARSSRSRRTRASAAAARSRATPSSARA